VTFPVDQPGWPGDKFQVWVLVHSSSMTSGQRLAVFQR
jgi:hypothetical protein